VGEFVDTDTCMDIIEGKKKMNAQYFHLSFDDGFRNNYLNALPLLQKHSVPAIFFVPTSLIGAEYSRTAKYCLETTQNCAVLEMMSWDEIEKVLESGCEIGSHTRSHAHLISISSDKGQMRDEIFGSKSDIESRLKTECKYFSWPYGREKDIDDVSLKMIADAGYRGCFGAYRGSILPEKTDRFRIPRHHFEPFWPVSHIQFFARGNFEKNY
jgi:peptidoglycan/xylan/chitin deacetylase (PgdA/CDA1 family)